MKGSSPRWIPSGRKNFILAVRGLSGPELLERASVCNFVLMRLFIATFIALLELALSGFASVNFSGTAGDATPDPRYCGATSERVI
jgi:hypothetical protein